MFVESTFQILNKHQKSPTKTTVMERTGGNYVDSVSSFHFDTELKKMSFFDIDLILKSLNSIMKYSKAYV